jgi:hypothetical protein
MTTNVSPAVGEVLVLRGGITSNLPVFLFDTPLPSRPTYAINLVDGGDRDREPADNIYRPTRAGAGLLPSASDISGIGAFVGAIQSAMQNWTDNALTRAVGQRDRICRISLASDEGGMNLGMDAAVIDSLVERGRAAGENLAAMQRSNPETQQWDKHRFGRFRAFLAGVGGYVGDAHHGWSATVPAGSGLRSYRDLSLAATQRGSGLPYASGWSAVRHGRVWQSLDTIDRARLRDFVTSAPAGVRLGVSVFDTSAIGRPDGGPGIADEGGEVTKAVTNVASVKSLVAQDDPSQAWTPFGSIVCYPSQDTSSRTVVENYLHDCGELPPEHRPDALLVVGDSLTIWGQKVDDMVVPRRALRSRTALAFRDVDTLLNWLCVLVNELQAAPQRSADLYRYVNHGRESVEFDRYEDV